MGDAPSDLVGGGRLVLSGRPAVRAAVPRCTRPISLAGLYLVGGAIGCLAVSIVELVLLSALPLDPVDDAGPNGAVYIVLGAGLLLIAAVYARRSRQPVTLEKKNPGEPSAARAFLTGLIVYSPGLGLIAAIKALSTHS